MKVNFMIAATMLCVVESVAQEVVPDSTVIRDLQEVVVDAKSAYTSAVKSTYIPTSRQKNTSQNLAELLQNMMVPTLQVSGNSVSTSEGILGSIIYRLASGISARDRCPQHPRRIACGGTGFSR